VTQVVPLRIAVLGGTGVFGSRAVDLLARDGHTVLAVARDAVKLGALGARLGVETLACDARSDLAPIWAWRPDVLCDAMGPFAAGPGAYARIEACLDHGVDYADLSDDAAFTAGVSVFEDRARSLGRRVLSGVSSVPALSSSVVADLTKGWDAVDSVRTAIVPGNRAPRGAAVVEGILARMGTPMVQVEGGVARARRTWSHRRVVGLAPGLRRAAWNIEVPDTALMGPWSGARTTTFHAGLELPLFGWGLWGLSLARSALRWPWPRPVLRTVLAVASWFDGWGTDVGGMEVDVRGWAGGDAMRCVWTLVARQGHGPWVPAVPMRALARAWSGVRPGARPALGEVDRAAMEAAFDGLDVVCMCRQEDCVPVFRQALGSTVWSGMDPRWQDTHAVLDTLVLRGRGRVERGKGMVVRALGWAFRFPPATDSVDVEVTKTRTASGETWVRRFGSRRFRSRLSHPDGQGGLTEAFGPFAFRLHLHRVAGTGPLVFEVLSARLWGIPWPRWALPQATACEDGADGVLRFDVRIDAPLGFGTIVHYTGALHLVQHAPVGGC
jgi:Domain of unknown function (DUF4166)